MSSFARPGRPFLVTLLALAPLVLALWYVVAAVEAGFLFAGEALFGGPAILPADVRLGPIVMAVSAIVAALWSLVTSSGLFGGAGWARVSAVLLSLFALPMGYPTDLAVTAVVILLLFIPANTRAYFH